MHREFDPADQPFERRSAASLYLLTTVVFGFVLLDLWPPLAGWLSSLGLDLPRHVSREWFGYRFALIAAVIGGARSLYSALEDIFDGKVGAEVAVAVACVAAILLGEPLIAAEVVAIGLLGECLEAVTFDRTQRALRSLAELFPVRTWVIRDGVEVRVFAADLQVGDLVVVKPGGRIPVDGVVTVGRSTIDTSALTGESVPTDVGPGEAVFAGGVNQLGAMTIRAEKVGTQTVAGRVIRLTAEALKDKAPIERHADRLAKRFLPVVLAVTVAVFLLNVGWQWLAPSGESRPSFGAAARVALYPTLAVLVVACPCPLVLATPAAVIAAMGRLAGTGVLVKGGAALERLATVPGFAFDKTGTLTEGRLRLADVLPLAGASAEDVLRTAAAIETKSEHPIARAILDAARERQLVLPDVVDFRAFPGSGVAGVVDGRPVFLGTRRFLLEQGLVLNSEAEVAFSRLDADGQSSVAVAVDGTLIGLIGTRDTLRPEAAGVLDDLRGCGLTLTLLTGDRDAAARAVVTGLPFDEVHTELLPADKATKLAGRGFVGDGINDAPALAAAHVGLAVGTGTDVAIEAADVVLMGEPLRPLPLLVRLSRETLRVIHQNIVWFGFGVNLIGVLLTGVLWPLFATSPDVYEKAPLAGVIYHQLGSFLVLVNSMRLLSFERPFSNGLVSRLRHANRTLEGWLVAAHPDNLFHELAHHARPIAKGVGLLVLLGWLTSGLTQVNVDQLGLVQRFGAVRDDLTPGLHVRWPWPIETVIKLRPAEPRTVPVGFRMTTPDEQRRNQLAKVEQAKLRRSANLPGITDRDSSWASAHADEAARRTDESLMVTGDGNLVELLATVRYTIADARKYHFGTRDPEAAVRSYAETVLRELVAGSSFLDLLTTTRASFEAAASARLAERLASVGEHLGVRLDGVTVHDLHPPPEVVTAYHSVAMAIQKRDKTINEAEAEATKLKARAVEDAVRLVRFAEAEAARKVADATAGRDAFLAWHFARTTLSQADESALAKEFEARIAGGADRVAVTAEISQRRQQLLSTRTALTDFRLGLAAVTSVLAGRDKILLDAADLPGKRHLLLADPDGFKLPPGLLRGTEKDP